MTEHLETQTSGTEGSRYLGSGTVEGDTRSLTGAPPSHLPPRLAITLWDFSWYTRAEDGGPYADLDAACARAAELGYNAIRICAAPLLLFGGLGLDALAEDLEIEGLGTAPDGEIYGRGTRWYDAPGGYRLNLRERLLGLFDAAERHGLVILLASWEYQQSPVFAASPQWFEAIDAVPLADRYRVLADAWDRLIRAVSGAGHRERIAMVELHNEVDFSILPALADGGTEQVQRLRQAAPGPAGDGQLRQAAAPGHAHRSGGPGRGPVPRLQLRGAGRAAAADRHPVRGDRRVSQRCPAVAVAG